MNEEPMTAKENPWSVRMPSELQEQVRQWAERDKRSINAEIVWILERFGQSAAQPFPAPGDWVWIHPHGGSSGNYEPGHHRQCVREVSVWGILIDEENTHTPWASPGVPGVPHVTHHVYFYPWTMIASIEPMAEGSTF